MTGHREGPGRRRRLPGLKRDLLTYLRERIKEVLTGASATVVVRIFGPEIEQLQSHAAAVKKALEGVDGTTDIQVQSQVLVPQVEVQFQPGSGRAVRPDAG